MPEPGRRPARRRPPTGLTTRSIWWCPFPPGSSPDILARTIRAAVAGAGPAHRGRQQAGRRRQYRHPSWRRPSRMATRCSTRSTARWSPPPRCTKKTLGYDRCATGAGLAGRHQPQRASGTVQPAGRQRQGLRQAGQEPRQLAELRFGRPRQLGALAMEMFKERAGVDLAHIPYSGFRRSSPPSSAATSRLHGARHRRAADPRQWSGCWP